MALTHEELCERLLHIDEVTLMEVLEISAEDIIDRFQDRIEQKRTIFEEDLER